MIPQEIAVPELGVILALSALVGIWGFRHGLDSVLIAALFVLFGMATADTLAAPVALTINVFGGLIKLIASGQFSRGALVDVMFGGPGAPPPLINLQDSAGSGGLRIIGTVLFLMIAYIGFKFAVTKAGGKDTLIEQIFGLVGGMVLGYIGLTFIIGRHFQFPQQVVIKPSEVPAINVNGPLIVAIVIVLIVFGVQRSPRSKPPDQKK